ncbi:MAG: hypothetical protein K1X89_01815 [Myxococcaceae bacterium]|nr:hypothetical protein [Myxococcaceae bacterium]
MDAVVQQLVEAGYVAAIHQRRPNIIDVRVEGIQLPEERCNEQTATIILPLPVTFPTTPPYGFFAVTPITLVTGTYRNVSAADPYRNATFFSRKCDGWNSTKHDVFTLLAYVNRWVRGG